MTHHGKLWRISVGDCLARLKELPADSVDAIVTDPPYGLAFMGKAWDYDVPTVEIWRECLRVLKPGAHLLAFAGTRTQHRMAVNIEDAGFEIRDMIAWVYGSGFPKSTDVSKIIDRMDAGEEQRARRLRFTNWVRSTGVTAQQIDAATNTAMGGHYTTAKSQPAIMTREHLEACRHLLGDVPEWVERETDIRSVESKNLAEREIVGERVMYDTRLAAAGFTGARHSPNFNGEKRVVPTTRAKTDAAKKWEGWGTALKPALEPITVARKPFRGSVSSNLLVNGCGALNIDGCRIEMGDEYDPDLKQRQQHSAGSVSGAFGAARLIGTEIPTYNANGRWPANLIHDGDVETTAGFPEVVTADGDTVSAARYFYCAKISAEDRNDGVDTDNNHPTVKPTDLMRYLCRLVTPAGGLVVDPFMGSGSTGRGAVLEGFRFHGMELSAEYCAIAAARIRACENLFTG